MDAGGGIREEASLLGGEGVRARTSTTFKSIDAGDATAIEAFRLPVFTVPEAGDSERLATPTARDSALPVTYGGDGDLERGSDSTTFKVEAIDDDDADNADDVEDDANAESP